LKERKSDLHDARQVKRELFEGAAKTLASEKEIDL
jgi:hypothetical protein